MPIWVQTFQDAFQRADGAAGNGWDDVNSQWSIVSDTLRSTSTSFGADLLARPIGEAQGDQRVDLVATFEAGNASPLAWARASVAAKNGYAAWLGTTGVGSNPAIALGTITGGSLTFASVAAPGLTVGSDYLVSLQCVGTTMTATVAAAGSPGTILGTATLTDSTYASGVAAVSPLFAPNTIKSVTVYEAVATVAVPVTDPNWFFSPYNWYSDGAGPLQANNVEASSTLARTTCPGAYFKVGFTGTSVALGVDTAPLSGGSIPGASWPSLAYSLDDGPFQAVQLSSGTGTPIAASGLAAGSHTLYALFERGDQEYDRWTGPANVVQVTGLTLDAGAGTVAPAGAIAVRPGSMVAYGDSITEGYFVTAATSPAGNDSRAVYVQSLAAALDAEVGVIGYGGQAWTAGGTGNVPAFPASWDHYDAAHSRLAAGALVPAPAWIAVNMGTNDGLGAEDPTAAARAWLGAVRAAAPSAGVALVVPFGGYVRSQLGAAFAAYQAATPDPLARLIDLGAAFQPGLDQEGTASARSVDGIHPDVYAHAHAGALLARAITAASGGSGAFPVLGCTFIQGD